MAFFNTNQAQEKSIMEFVNILILYGIDTDILISKRDEYLNNMTSKINFNIPVDIYIHICDFLHFDDILNLTNSSNRLYTEYYKYIWQIFQNRYFPRSLLSDYTDIIKNTSIHIYYTLKLNMLPINKYQFGTISYIDIHDESNIYKIKNVDKYISNITQLEYNEYKIKNLLDENNQINTKMLNYKDRITTNNNQLNSIYKEINNMKFHEIDTNIFLNNFKFNSVVGINNIKYYTIKPNIDMRLYGFDPNIKEQYLKGLYKIDNIMYINQYQIYDIEEWCDYNITEDKITKDANDKYQKIITYFTKKLDESENYIFPDTESLSMQFIKCIL
jgi:hypothetical protein